MPKDPTQRELNKARRKAKANANRAISTPPLFTQKKIDTRDLASRDVLDDAFKAPLPALARKAVDMDRKTLSREAILLHEAWIKNERKLGLEDFWYFTTRQLFPDSEGLHYSNKFHKDIADELQALKTGDTRWWIVPREHRKSYIITMAHSIWRIIKDPDIRILVIAEKKEITAPFSELVRSAFVAGTPAFEHFQTIWGDYCWDDDEFSKKVSKAKTNWTVKKRRVALADPTFRASYVGISAAWRCDILIYDDAVSDKNAANPDMSRQTLGKMMRVLPMLQTGSKYRYILGVGTRYAYHDPYSYILGEDTGEHADSDTSELIKERFAGDRVRITVRHAFEHPHRLCTKCPPHITKMSPHGDPAMPTQDPEVKPIVPDIIPQKILLQRLQDYLMNPDLGESAYWHQYMNICVAPKNQKFKEEWFHFVNLPVWPSYKKRVLAVDSAHKDMAKEVGDYMVATFAEYDNLGRCLVVKMLRSNKWTRDEFTRQILAFCMATSWWPQLVVKEKFGEDTYLKDLYRAFLEHARPVHTVVATRKHDTTKHDFITESLQGPMERHEIVFGRNVDKKMFERAQYELTNLGQTTHDDTADCLALLMHPKVRVVKPNNPIGSSDSTPWQCPQLDLYNPDGPIDRAPLVPTEGPTNPFQQAFAEDSPLGQFAVDQFGHDINLQWDPAAPEALGFEWSENE